MKRTPIQRHRPLRADPEKVREFLRRGRENRRRRTIEGPLTAAEWRAATYAAAAGRCIVTGARARNVDDRAFHAHHGLPASALRSHGHFDRVFDSRNGLWIARDVHLRGIGRHPDIPRVALPGLLWEFAAELDAREGTQWATYLLRRIYH
jgi:hypothetical protein